MSKCSRVWRGAVKSLPSQYTWGGLGGLRDISWVLMSSVFQCSCADAVIVLDTLVGRRVVAIPPETRK